MTEQSNDNVAQFPARDDDNIPVFRKPDPQFEATIREKLHEIKSKRAERKEVTTSITALYTALEKLGLDKKAIKAYFTFEALDDDQKRVFDLSFQAVRSAMGCPVQMDLFEEGVKRDVQERANG